MAYRLSCVVTSDGVNQRVRHFAGAPPESGIGPDNRTQLPWPNFLTITEREDGFFLERVLFDGTIVGDTSHADLQEAIEQAAWEYGENLSQWIQIPAYVSEEEIADFLIRNGLIREN